MYSKFRPSYRPRNSSCRRDRGWRGHRCWTDPSPRRSILICLRIRYRIIWYNSDFARLDRSTRCETRAHKKGCHIIHPNDTGPPFRNTWYVFDCCHTRKIPPSAWSFLFRWENNMSHARMTKISRNKKRAKVYNASNSRLNQRNWMTDWKKNTTAGKERDVVGNEELNGVQSA